MGLINLILLLLAAMLLLGLLLRLLNPLPPMPARVASSARPAGDGQLAGLAAAEAARHPGKSGVAILHDGVDAFASRAILAAMATHSLDLQYYIWQGDTSGRLLMQALLQAADRGVRVRLLLDDNGTAGLDKELAALDAHPDIEVRLFNPFVIRRPKMVGYIMDFSRLNRRMHNKAFIADNAAAVIGGRNVGDEYFGASATSQFDDLDLLSFGPVVPELSADFDRYWESRSSYPVSAILPPAPPGAVAQLRRSLVDHAAGPLADRYATAIRENLLASRDAGTELDLEWAPVTMLSDDPAKGQGEVPRGALLADQLALRVGAPAERLSLVSAYFVPGREGTVGLGQLAAKGIEVDVMTNALEATDVAAVHAGYARHRETLLKAGVRIWEQKSAPGERTRLRIGLSAGSGRKPVIVASGTSLHAKTMAVDDKRLFVGSFNFDPRSVALNTELGFLIESPKLAEQLHSGVDAEVRARAYEVRLSPEGRLQWLDRQGGKTVVHDTEPGTRWYQRLAVRALALLPIDWLL